MSKSTVAVAALGLFACGALSLMMKQAVGMHADQRRAPWLPALEARFRERILGQALVREEALADGLRVVLSVRTSPGVDAARLAHAVGHDAWLHLGRAGTTAKELVVSVRGDDGAPPQQFPIAQPTPGR